MRYQLFLLFITGVFVLSQYLPAYPMDSPMSESESKQESRQEKQSRDDLVITASKSEINRREIGASVTVITDRQMEERGERMVADALKGVPGLYISQTGPFGMASMYMRGSKSRDVLVLIDGVRVNDPSTANNMFDFAHLSADNVERVEVIRGAQSVIHGASATGGVINIITRRGAGSPKVAARAEAGSFRTFRESITSSGGTEESTYSVSLERTDRRGFSSAAKAQGAADSPERDGYENTTVSSRIGLKVLRDSWLNCAIRYFDARTDVDDDGYDDDPNYRQYSRQFSGVMDFTQPIFRWWEHRVVLNYMNNERRSRDLADTADSATANGWYSGTRREAEWRHTVNIADVDIIRFGVTVSQERAENIYESDYGFGASTTSFGPAKSWSRAAYAQNHLRLFDSVFATTGVRYTDHETFGSHTDYQLAGSVIAPWTGTRLRGEVATGFQAPSLSELYDTTFKTNNPDLKPQESTTVDIGVEQPFFDRIMVVEVSFFRSKYKNMFGTDVSTSKTINRDRVTTEGMELTARLAPFRALSVDGCYTYLKKAEDESTGKRLVRNPKHQGSLYVNLFLLDRINVNCGVRYVSERDDYWYDAAWTQHAAKLGDYYVASAAVMVDVTKSVQVFTRAENILNRSYEDPAGFQTPRRSFYGGIKAVF